MWFYTEIFHSTNNDYSSRQNDDSHDEGDIIASVFLDLKKNIRCG